MFFFSSSFSGEVPVKVVTRTLFSGIVRMDFIQFHKINIKWSG